VLMHSSSMASAASIWDRLTCWQVGGKEVSTHFTFTTAGLSVSACQSTALGSG
jgi:hypothetical protein